MSAATILFIDLVGFSRKPTADQKKLVEALTAEVLYQIRPLLNPPRETSNVVALPTGDGMALAFVHPAISWNHSTILGLIFELHKWAHDLHTEASPVSLRVGVHVGQVEFITDINGKANLCGDTINFAQRVMDAADGRQTLYSDAAFREYIGMEYFGNESNRYVLPPFSDECRAHFEGPFEVFAKHGMQINVFKMVLEKEQEYWSNKDPVAKHLMAVSLTPLPKTIVAPSNEKSDVGAFGKKLEKATHIAFIQLTGERFIDKELQGLIEFSKPLKRFWVFMPDPDAYQHPQPSKPQPTQASLRECIQKWRELFSKLTIRYPDADFKLGLFKEPPYFGASFLDWDRPDGRIHVSPYVWDVPTHECPGYDLQWLGKKPSQIYETYIAGLEYLHRNTENELKK